MSESQDYPAIASLSDEELVEEYRSIKDPSNGPPPQPGSGRGGAIEAEMIRRGLMPDREDIIPDEDIPEPDPESLTGRVENLPPRTGSSSGDDGGHDRPA
jgi:hypothetical protein